MILHGMIVDHSACVCKYLCMLVHAESNIIILFNHHMYLYIMVELCSNVKEKRGGWRPKLFWKGVRLRRLIFLTSEHLAIIYIV